MTTLTTLLLIWAVVASVVALVFGYLCSKFSEIADQWREKHSEVKDALANIVPELNARITAFSTALEDVKDGRHEAEADSDNWKRKYELLNEDHARIVTEYQRKSRTLSIIVDAANGQEFIKVRERRKMEPRRISDDEIEAAMDLAEPSHSKWTATVPEMGSIDCTCKELLAGQYHQPGCPIVEVNGMEVVENV